MANTSRGHPVGGEPVQGNLHKLLRIFRSRYVFGPYLLFCRDRPRPFICFKTADWREPRLLSVPVIFTCVVGRSGWGADKVGLPKKGGVREDGQRRQ